MVRNILSVIVGLVVGSAVNMGLITVGASIVPPPPGVDVTDPESISASMHLFEAKHFIVPFLAHALGTFSGALGAFFVAKSHQNKFAYGIGAVFLFGGIYASLIIPAPTWFIVLDIAVAYLPMAWAAIQIGKRFGR
ncbi:hypothetical protein [Aliikangiella coralliicola]|uniref:Uncharacterized protein n=1 Tax=Aliikangiella coralliicola TaxID=2592383 RepID=A0A545UH88_9GAMM|nr:hypothetical protein [Aliikangiella coralliicola]TQV88828.1 hypothetical protein FLL46_04660 [Aliikangiella coralliicola]